LEEEDAYLYNYFVSYIYTNEDNRVEFGNLTVKLPQKIRSYEDIEDLQVFLNGKIIPIKGSEKKQFLVLGYNELFK
jgi:hypothetical protein